MLLALTKLLYGQLLKLFRLKKNGDDNIRIRKILMS